MIRLLNQLFSCPRQRCFSALNSIAHTAERTVKPLARYPFNAWIRVYEPTLLARRVPARTISPLAPEGNAVEKMHSLEVISEEGIYETRLHSCLAAIVLIRAA